MAVSIKNVGKRKFKEYLINEISIYAKFMYTKIYAKFSLTTSRVQEYRRFLFQFTDFHISIYSMRNNINYGNIYEIFLCMATYKLCV
jgi:hypothetical protein